MSLSGWLPGNKARFAGVVSCGNGRGDYGYGAVRVKVWLDDRRPAPEGWVHVRTPEEAVDLLRAGGVQELSLDHDLGLGVGVSERTGYDVLLWLEREVAAGRARPPAVIRVHSGNVGAVGRMEQAVESIRRLAGEG
jgi:hypothetical protein